MGIFKAPNWTDPRNRVKNNTTNRIQYTTTFPSFVQVSISRPVAMANFKRKCSTPQYKMTAIKNRPIKGLFHTKNDDTFIL